jgi:hypothetical protein
MCKESTSMVIGGTDAHARVKNGMDVHVRDEGIGKDTSTTGL